MSKPHHVRRIRCLQRVLFSLALAAAAPALAELPQYSVTKLETWWGGPDAQGFDTFGIALNNSNEVLAVYKDYTTGLQVWDDGVRTATAPAYPSGYSFSTAHLRGYTNAGTYAVDVYNPVTDTLKMAVLDMRHASSSFLPDIPGAVMDGSAPVLSNNSQFASARSDDVIKGWRLDLGSNTWTELVGPGWYVQPDAVNNSGAVAGRMADASGNTVPFVWTAGAGMEAITDQGAAIYGQAMAINDAGFVTGTADGKAFVLNSGNMELTWLTPAAGQSAVDINNAGQIIGTFWNPPFLGVPGDAGWVATAGDGFQPLENLIGQDLTNPEWRINEAFDINDVGWILANAYNYNDQRGYQVLLRPVPEPGAAALLAFGSLGFLRRRRASISSPSTA